MNLRKNILLCILLSIVFLIVIAPKSNAVKLAINASTSTKNQNNSSAEKNVTRSNNTVADKSDETTSDDNEEKVSDLKKLTIKGINLTPAFSPEIYEYKVDVTGDISSLDIEAEGINHNVSIDIVGNENLTDGENTITLLVYNEETKQNSTYQIMVNKTNVENNGLNNSLTDAAKKANTIRYSLLGIVGFIIVIILIFVIARRNLNKNNNEMYEYDEDDRERLNLVTNKPKRKGKHF